MLSVYSLRISVIELFGLEERQPSRRKLDLMDHQETINGIEQMDKKKTGYFTRCDLVNLYIMTLLTRTSGGWRVAIRIDQLHGRHTEYGEELDTVSIYNAIY